MVLIKFPLVDEVTLTDTVQRPGVVPDWAGTVPPLREKDVAPGVAVTVPPQLLVSPTELAMLRPGWTLTRLSVQAAFVSAKPLGLNIVTLKRDVPPVAIEIGEKLLFISAGRDIWAYAVCLGTARIETISTATKRDMIDLRIFYPLNIEGPMLNKRNRHYAVGFAIGSPRPIQRSGSATRMGCGSMHPHQD
jgi:hypothetical protein